MFPSELRKLQWVEEEGIFPTRITVYWVDMEEEVLECFSMENAGRDGGKVLWYFNCHII